MGPRYKQQTRIYKDEIFEFSTDNHPQNVIITGKNSFGKGVFLQLLFQPMIPKTPWSRGKNKVSHFFYGKKGQHKPYTFYTCLDFHLAEDQHLLVGIAITSQLNEKYDSEPIYTLFVREYGFSLVDEFAIESLPLYNKEKEAPSPYPEFMEYLRENKKEFLTFTENTKNKFYQTMESYGIIKKDWEQLIDINQYEGGVAHYFDDKNATTNDGLFSKMIIPAIEARLNEKGEEHHLVTLFRNIASITRNLPEIKKNASTYKEIKEHNADIYSNLLELMDEKENLHAHIEKGRSILNAFSIQVIKVQNEANDHKTELERLLIQKKSLEWKLQNLQFMKKFKEKDSLQLEVTTSEEELRQKESRETEVKTELFLAELQLQLRKWHEEEIKMKDVLQQIEAIEQSKEFQESISAQKEIKEGLQVEWTKVVDRIHQILIACNAYHNYIKQQETTIKGQITEYRDELVNYKVRERELETSISQFETELEKEISLYGEYFYYDMEKVLSQKRQELQECMDVQSDLLTDQENKQSDKTRYIHQQVAIEVEIKGLDGKLAELTKQHSRQQSRETAIMQKVWRVLRMNPVTVKDFRQWLQEQVPSLRNKKSDWELVLNKLNLQWYGLAFEVKQKDKPYLIPSEEVHKVKSLLEEKGIAVSYGDEYIKQLEAEKRMELNQKHPLLKYGLIIPSHYKSYMVEIQKIDKEFFHTPIPIFWVSELELSSEMPFILLDKKATELSLDDEKLRQYKQDLSNKSDIVKTEIQNTSEFIDELHSVVVELESFDTHVTTHELEQEINMLKTEILEKKADETSIKLAIESIEISLKDISVKLEGIVSSIQSLVKETEKLNGWILAKKKYESEKPKLLETQLKIKGINGNIEKQENELSKIASDLELWNPSYYDWINKKDKLVEKVRTVIPNVYIQDVEATHEHIESQKPVFSIQDSELNKWMYQWEALQQEINSRNTQLIELRADLKHHQRSVKTEEDKLKKLDSQWHQFEIPLDSIAILEEKVKEKEKEWQDIKDRMLTLNSDLKHYRSQIKSLDEELDTVKVAMDKDYNKVPELWEITDFEKVRIEIQHELNSSIQDINDTNKILTNLNNRVTMFNSFYQKMNATLNTIYISTGVIPSSFIQEMVTKDPQKTWEDWIKTYKVLEQNVTTKKKRLQSIHRKKKEIFEKSEWVLEIKDVSLKVYNDMNFEELEEVKASIEGLDLLATNEIAEAEEERNTAEEAKREWVEHACKYALQIVEHLRKMIKAMKITNRNGLSFPIVKLKRENILPKEMEQIKGNIEDLFDRVISKVFIDYAGISIIPSNVLKNKISTKNILYAALNYQYPTLWLYRLHEENSFLYEPPKDDFYTEWETINESSKTDPAGSGGQLFSARTLILMMLTSFKRTNDDNTNWKLLITDNPFSVAVSDHIVDPILAIAEELKFQWIVVTPPELVKIELLQKFDVYYQLSAKNINNGTDQVVSEVQYGYRNYKKINRIMKSEKISIR